MNKLEKMEIRKKISGSVSPLLAIDIKRPAIFKDIIEQKTHDVFDLFLDGYEFWKK